MDKAEETAGETRRKDHTRTAQEIVATMRSDRERGFAMLMARYKAPIYWHIRRLVVSHDDAQDATQETFVRTFRSIGKLKDDKALAVWLYRIATNEALRLIGRRRREVVPLDTPGHGADSVLADDFVDYSDLEAVKLQKAILSLPTKQRLTFNLRYYDELGYDEIAQITGSTAASAKVNYHVAKDKIVRHMNTTD